MTASNREAVRWYNFIYKNKILKLYIIWSGVTGRRTLGGAVTYCLVSYDFDKPDKNPASEGALHHGSSIG